MLVSLRVFLVGRGGSGPLTAARGDLRSAPFGRLGRCTPCAHTWATALCRTFCSRARAASQLTSDWWAIRSSICPSQISSPTCFWGLGQGNPWTGPRAVLPIVRDVLAHLSACVTIHEGVRHPPCGSMGDPFCEQHVLRELLPCQNFAIAVCWAAHEEFAGLRDARDVRPELSWPRHRELCDVADPVRRSGLGQLMSSVRKLSRDRTRIEPTRDHRGSRDSAGLGKKPSCPSQQSERTYGLLTQDEEGTCCLRQSSP